MRWLTSVVVLESFRARLFYSSAFLLDCRWEAGGERRGERTGEGKKREADEKSVPKPGKDDEVEIKRPEM